MAPPNREDPTLRDTVATTLANHPVSVGFLFGSQARGEAHERSDDDVRRLRTNCR